MHVVTSLSEYGGRESSWLMLEGGWGDYSIEFLAAGGLGGDSPPEAVAIFRSSFHNVYQINYLTKTPTFKSIYTH